MNRECGSGKSDTAAGNKKFLSLILNLFQEQGLVKHELQPDVV